jgi:hypothetical protein
MAVAAFAMSGAMAVIGVMAYTRVPSMMKLYLSEMKLELTQTILDQVPVPEMPKLPKATGPAIPFK